MKEQIKEYDLCIIGGGLAGSTLALQVKQHVPGISVLVIERSSGPSHISAHKVGESSSELGAAYLKDKLGLRDYLLKEHVIKLGTRFFLEAHGESAMANRLEFGPAKGLAQETFHLDRGKLEWDLFKMLRDLEVELMTSTRVTDCELDRSGHELKLESEDSKTTIKCKWIVDASGRSSFLKRKLKLQLESNHHANAVWFRIQHHLKVDDWSVDPAWIQQRSHGVRALSTNHLMGKGYWVWIIPLPSGTMSIGIVTDPKLHAFEDLNTKDKAWDWFKLHEPVAYEQIQQALDDVLDFKVMKDFANNSSQYYSEDRWALTGDAACFLDPLYSPGLDFIALGNSWITELIRRDLAQEPIEMLTKIYETTHRQLYEGWLKIFQDAYPLYGNEYVMLVKIAWDWATYWAIPNVMFVNDGYLNPRVIKEYSKTSSSIGLRFARLNEQMQKFLNEWNETMSNQQTSHLKGMFDIFSLDTLLQFQETLHLKYSEEDLVKKIASNLDILEAMAAEICGKVFRDKFGLNEEINMDPYTMELSDGLSDLISKSKEAKSIHVPAGIRSDIDRLWSVVSKSQSSVRNN